MSDEYDMAESDYLREDNDHQKNKSEMKSIETQAVVVRESSAVGQALGVNEILAQVRLIQDVMSKVMTDGEHYGVIPGTGTKKTLLQPGAQKLTMTFRLAPEYELQETNLQNGHKEYRVICTLKSIQTGNFVGQGVGCCTTLESKYRYRSGSRKCPLCGAEAIIKGKAEYGGGWLCFAKKGGCGAKWDDKEEAAKAIAAQMTEKVECDNPADFFNTCLKMAKKRAFVDATITATAASDIFTQDIGDDEPNGDVPPAPGAPPASPPKPKTASSPPPAAKTHPAPSWTKRTPNEQKEHVARLEAWLGQCKTSLLQRLMPVTAGAEEYAKKTGLILANEVLPDVSLNKLFPSVNWDFTVDQNKPLVTKDFQALTKAVQDFMDGDRLPDEDDLPMGEAEAPGQNKPIEVPRDEHMDPNSPDAAWRSFPLPYGKNAGVKLGELDKATLWGWWANHVVETEYKGRPKKAEDIATSRALRAFLDEAGKAYEFTKKD